MKGGQAVAQLVRIERLVLRQGNVIPAQRDGSMPASGSIVRC
jgi:hypothetical protein